MRVMASVDRLRDASNGAEDAFFRRLDIFRMDIARGPVTDRSVLLGSNRENAQFRMVAEDGVTDVWSLPRLLKRDDQQIGQRLIHPRGNLCVRDRKSTRLNSSH